MSPLREVECADCNTRYETLIRNDDDLKEIHCPSCKSDKFQLCLSYPASYNIYGANGASTRPRRMGGNK